MVLSIIGNPSPIKPLHNPYIALINLQNSRILIMGTQKWYPQLWEAPAWGLVELTLLSAAKASYFNVINVDP